VDSGIHLTGSGPGRGGFGDPSRWYIWAVDVELPICGTCGVQYGTTRDDCPICLDERQYVGWGGQRWTTLAALGGVSAIAISHPHFYGSMVEWAHAFDAPVYIHANDRRWVARPDKSIVFWEGDTHSLGDGLTLINAGVHFDGGQVLHWAGGEGGSGSLFSGDIFSVVLDRRWVTFMYSYPNYIPERPRTIRRALTLLEPYAFTRVYGGWWNRVVYADGHAAIKRSAERYFSYALDDS
jgi:hypothetical protein